MLNNCVTSKNVESDNHLWLQFWRDQRADFHQTVVNPLLVKFWSSLNLEYGSRVFVPLCGKSLDMIWLAQQGHEVIGVELSPVAVQAFFSENGFKPIKKRVGKFMLWKCEKISILCGDYFSLQKSDLGLFDTVYDRAALTALSENVRRLYVAQLKKIVLENTKIFLLTIEDSIENVKENLTIEIDEEINALYSGDFEIDLAYMESVFEQNLESPSYQPNRADYKVYRLKCIFEK